MDAETINIHEFLHGRVARCGGFGIALLLVLCAVHCGCKAKPSSLLPLEEVVCLINERTPIQLNFEKPDYGYWQSDTSQWATVVEDDIEGWNIRHVIRFFQKWPHLHVVTNQGVYTLCARSGFTNGISFDVATPTIVLSNAHPFEAGYQLAQKLPFNLLCSDPYPFEPSAGPLGLDVDLPWWPTNTFVAQSFNITNGSIRDAMIEMFNVQ